MGWTPASSERARLKLPRWKAPLVDDETADNFIHGYNEVAAAAMQLSDQVEEWSTCEQEIAVIFCRLSTAMSEVLNALIMDPDNELADTHLRGFTRLEGEVSNMMLQLAALAADREMDVAGAMLKTLRQAQDEG